MDGRKSKKGKRSNRKGGIKRKTYQEFIDGIADAVNERKEIEELFKRVLVFKSENVLQAMEIQRKNNEILQAHILSKSGLRNAENNDAENI